MVYSCAYFTEPHDDIARAQRDKLDMICRKLRLKPDETFLDIGCGWGALVMSCGAALRRARPWRDACPRSNSITPRRRWRASGLQDRVTIELKDYSRLDGAFDKIASIGMFEHVGLANYERYFRTMNRLLKPGGLYLHHAIARPAKRTDREFFRKYSAEA